MALQGLDEIAGCDSDSLWGWVLNYVSCGLEIKKGAHSVRRMWLLHV